MPRGGIDSTYRHEVVSQWTESRCEAVGPGDRSGQATRLRNDVLQQDRSKNNNWHGVAQYAVPAGRCEDRWNQIS